MVPGGWLVAALLAAIPAPGLALVEHRMEVEIAPQAGHIAVRDTVTVPAADAPGARVLTFSLHADLAVEADPALALAQVERLDGPVPLRVWRIRLGPGARVATLRYGGRIHHPPAATDGAMRGAAPASAGIVSAAGVYLDGASGWYPRFADGAVRFALEVDLPAGWTAVSQGARTRPKAAEGRARVRWTEHQPQDDIYLVAGRFHEYARPGPVAEAQVFLREADDDLAARYLEATERYLALFSELLGPYPYAKFALVENFWETGYGMPSFTLLGARVIRLPFILHTSFPHEILHNWWGNGVYVDYARGNWAEGLTAYLADHLLKERLGEGAAYRRGALQKYADYVRGARDFPLTAFRGRHDEASQAVGYHKTLMVLHMLRRRLGDQAFVSALRDFFRDHRFQVAGWDALRRAFEARAGVDLGAFFEQWLTRTGAPELALRDARAEPEDGRWRLRFSLEQVQAGRTYSLRVPVAVTLAGRAEAEVIDLAVDGARADFDLPLDARPLRLDVDPAFDVFRRLDPGEMPVSFGTVFGADRVTLVLPADAPADLSEGYARLALAWTRRAPGVEMVRDDRIEHLPDDRGVWLLGWENRFRGAALAALGALPVSFDQEGIVLAGAPVPRAGHSAALAARRGEAALGWIVTDTAAALPGLARKLPHYSRFGYAAFAGAAPDNVLKGEWPVAGSPLSGVLDPAAAGSGPALPPRAALAAPGG